MNKLVLSALMCALALGMSACEKKGAFEQAGEEVDEAARTIKNGGKETTGDKIDDAADDLRKGAEKAKKEVTN